MESEKDNIDFFKKCEADDFERKDHFNSKHIINEQFRKTKFYLIKYYWDMNFGSDIEQLFDDIYKIILEILESDGKNLEKEMVFKILNFESKFVDFSSCCKT